MVSRRENNTIIRPALLWFPFKKAEIESIKAARNVRHNRKIARSDDHAISNFWRQEDVCVGRQGFCRAIRQNTEEVDGRSKGL
jgi:hypothetical protein